MELVQFAKDLALRQKLRIFPLAPFSKVPPKGFDDYAHQATTDLAQIEAWWKENPRYNIGISTEDMIGVDVDNKAKKPGLAEMARLASEGKIFPETFEQLTSTQGHHFLYTTDTPVRNGVNVLGPGIDIRGTGGYLVGAGSILATGVYSAIPRPIRSAPEWIVEACRKSRDTLPPATPEQLALIEPARAIERAIRYLLTEAPIATSGENGDQCTFAIAAKLKDIGCDAGTAAFLMLEHWNDRCIPPWTPEDIDHKVANAFKYGKNPAGIDAPEIQFASVTSEPKPPDEIDEFNKNHIYIAGNSGFVVHETEDEEGKPAIDILGLDKLHTNEAAKMYGEGKNIQPLTRAWVKSPRRRTCQKIVFSPGEEVASKFYNLWKGFTIKPLDTIPTPRAAESVEAFLYHVKQNICAGDSGLYVWLMAYLGHMIQKPNILPMVALVLRGKKGVGKNVFINQIGGFLGMHYTTESTKHAIANNFNSLLENKLLLVLDEAFWSGDKQNEGVLKSWITAVKHVIERKGHERYEVRNRMRLIILANDEWAIPASADERRYAVFEVGENKMQDTDFFGGIVDGLAANEGEGHRLLLKTLLEVDVSAFKIGNAYKTKGLLEQKKHSSDPTAQWWRDCLGEGRILGFGLGSWPEFIQGDTLRNSLREEMNKRNIRTWLKGSTGTTQVLKEMCPSIATVPRRVDGVVCRHYQLPPLAQARKEWEKYIGHEEEWESEDEDLFS